MALSACVECGRQVSEYAAACPGCGMPVADRLSPQSAAQPQVARTPALDAQRGMTPTSLSPRVAIGILVIGATLVGAMFVSISKGNKPQPSSDDKAQESARLEQCPDLPTWAACDARMRAAAAATASALAEQQAAKLADAKKDLDRMWVDFDKRPKRDKPALIETMEAATFRIAIAEQAPQGVAILEGRNRAHYRVRMAPFVQPPTRAIGDGYKTLVPHPDQGPCLVWGSMWMNNEETAAAMESLGFEWVKCGATVWNVRTRQKV